MSDHSFDLIVVGSGPAASSIMNRCAIGGLKVAVVEERALGGTCALRGCSPKKILLSAAEAMDWLERMEGKGVEKGAARINWGDLMKFKNSYTDPIPGNDRKKLKDAGISYFEGHAGFTASNELDVDGIRLVGKKIALATGARPTALRFSGAEYVRSSDEFLELPELPEEILFIGGGYISMEFACIAAAAGADVTVIQRGPFILKGFDPELAQTLVDALSRRGIRVLTRCEAKAIRKTATGFVLETSGEKDRELRATAIFHGGGRVPNLDNMNLDAGNVAFSSRGVRVNEFQQSESNCAVYAAGDCADTPGVALTPIAGREGRAAALNILEGNHSTVDYTGCASVAFTLPNIATVGLTVKRATEQGLEFTIHKGESGRWFSNRRIGSTCGAYKILVQEQTNRILGAHLLGHEAGEIVNLFALAIRQGLTMDDMKDNLWAYPTLGSELSRMFG